MFQMIDQDQNYTYEIFREEDSIECARFLAHSFTNCNPYELYMKTTYERFYEDALALCRGIAHSKLSIIARQKDTNAIDAMVQGVDLKTFNQDEGSFPNVADGKVQHPDPIMGLLQEFEKKYVEDYEKKFGALTENCVAHILMAGVRPECIGRGLGTKILQVFLEHARQRGFKYVTVDTTSPAINHICTQKLNGHVVLSVYASTWTSKNDLGDDCQPLEGFESNISLIVFDLIKNL